MDAKGRNFNTSIAFDQFAPPPSTGTTLDYNSDQLILRDSILQLTVPTKMNFRNQIPGQHFFGIQNLPLMKMVRHSLIFTIQIIQLFFQ